MRVICNTHGVSTRVQKSLNGQRDVWKNTHKSVRFLKIRCCENVKTLCFFLGNSPVSEFYMLTFRNTLFHLHRQVGARRSFCNYLPMMMEQSVPKSRHIKFRPRGINRKKAYNIQNTAEV